MSSSVHGLEDIAEQNLCNTIVTARALKFRVDRRQKQGLCSFWRPVTTVADVEILTKETWKMRPSAAPTWRACSAGSITALCSADGNAMDLSSAPAYGGSTSQASGMHSNTCMHGISLQPLLPLLLLLRSRANLKAELC